MIFEKRDDCWRQKHHSPTIATEKIILFSLHIKLGIMKQFLKSLNRDENAFDICAVHFQG